MGRSLQDFPDQERTWSVSGPDNWGRGRGGFDGGGVSRGGRGGGHGGMGSTGE